MKEESKAQVESTAARRHRELLELHKDIANHNASQINDLYVKLNTISYNTTAVHKCVGDLLVEEERFHQAWHETQARLEKHNTRLSSWHLITNVLRLIVNAGILVVLVMYLMDMG